MERTNTPKSAVLKTAASAVFMAVSLAVTLMLPSAAYSASTTNRITSVKVDFDLEGADPGECRIATPKASGSHYSVTDYSWSVSPENWTVGKKYTLTVTLEPADDYHFEKSVTTVSVVGSNAEVISKSIASRKITAKISYYPKFEFSAPTDIEWLSDFEARWKKVTACSKYEVKMTLTDDDFSVTTKTVTVTTNRIDFSDYATDYDTEITFMVRAVPADTAQKAYASASDWTECGDVVSADDDNTVSGSWTSSGAFKDENGDKVSGWQFINGYWYYFDKSDSYRASTSKWMYIDGYWYHFDANSCMETGWIKSYDLWYFLYPATGAMAVGWTETAPGSWYYLNPVEGMYGLPEGAMLSGTVIDGYVLDDSGLWVQ